MKRLTRLQSIRKFCVQCMGGSTHLPKECPATKCKLYRYRLGRGGGSKGTVIRKYCLDCVGSPLEIKNCTDEDCSLYRFRFGYNYNRTISKNSVISRFSTRHSTKTPKLI